MKVAKRDHLFGFTGDVLKDHFEQHPLSDGDQVMLYSGPAHFHVYELVTVVSAASGRQKRIIVSKPGESGGTTFYRSGKNCFHPKGMTKLIPVIDWVVEQMQGKQKIVFGWDWEVSARY